MDKQQESEQTTNDQLISIDVVKENIFNDDDSKNFVQAPQKKRKQRMRKKAAERKYLTKNFSENIYIFLTNRLHLKTISIPK